MLDLMKSFTNTTLQASVTPIEIDGEFYFLPSELEGPLGFVDLADSLRKSPGFVRDVDYILLRGAQTSQFRDAQSKRSITPVAANIHTMIVLTESGLYALLFKSAKERAVEFRVWVTSEVLPALRKTGKYAVEAAKDRLANTTSEFKAACELAGLFGFTGNQQLLAASKAVMKVHGVDCHHLLEADLKSEVQERLLTATDVGLRLTPRQGPQVTNRRLEQAGLQAETRNAKNELVWRLTDTGKQYGVYLDTGKKSSTGVPVQQIKWYERVVGVL